MRWKFLLKSGLEVVVFASIPWLSHWSKEKSTDPMKIQRRFGEDPTIRWKILLKFGLKVVFFASIQWLSHRSEEKSIDLAKIRQRSGGWNSLRLQPTRSLSTKDRSDSTWGCSQSAAGRSTSHLMWAGRFRFGHKPDLDWPVDTPSPIFIPL